MSRKPPPLQAGENVTIAHGLLLRHVATPDGQLALPVDPAAIARAEGIDVPSVGDDTELDDDLVRDMTEVLTSFCARLYGRRAAKHRAEKALEAMRDERV